MKRLFTLIIATLLALISITYLSIAEETRYPNSELKRTLSQDYIYDSGQYVQHIT